MIVCVLASAEALSDALPDCCTAIADSIVLASKTLVRNFLVIVMILFGAPRPYARTRRQRRSLRGILRPDFDRKLGGT
jgi:hypothetical protein